MLRGNASVGYNVCMHDQLLDLYSDYLISSFDATTATGLAAVLDGAVSHDQITRFLAGAKRSSADLWRVVKPQVRRIQTDDGVLIIDDSIASRRPTKMTSSAGITTMPTTAPSKGSIS